MDVVVWSRSHLKDTRPSPLTNRQLGAELRTGEPRPDDEIFSAPLLSNHEKGNTEGIFARFVVLLGWFQE